ncbi:hypothetical protein AgCh_028425 [Apium graveolens]
MYESTTPLVIEEYIISKEVNNSAPCVPCTSDQVISPIIDASESQEHSQDYYLNDSEPDPEPILSDDLDLPIALRKGKRQPCPNPRYPISQYVAYESLSPKFQAFTASISSHHNPNKLFDALLKSEWKAAMCNEIDALEKK